MKPIDELRWDGMSMETVPYMLAHGFVQARHLLSVPSYDRATLVLAFADYLSDNLEAVLGSLECRVWSILVSHCPSVQHCYFEISHLPFHSATWDVPDIEALFSSLGFRNLPPSAILYLFLSTA